MVLRQTGAMLLMIIVLRLPINDGRPRVNAKPCRQNICTVHAAIMKAGTYQVKNIICCPRRLRRIRGRF